MRNLPLIAGALYLEPWCIRGDVHAEFSRQFREYQSGQRVAGNEPSSRQPLPASQIIRDRAGADDPVGGKWRNRFTGEEGFYHPQVEKSHGIAMLGIEGVIGKHLSSFELQCFGGVDLAIIEQQFANIRDDSEIHTLILNFNTPGGRAQGVDQAAQAIREVSAAGKKVIAYTDTCSASAGYFLMAACDEIYAQQDAIVGSISTICAGVDESRAWEMEGLELKLVATGSLKGMGTPGKKWTDEEMQFLRDRAKVVDDVFKGFVRDRRGIADEHMQGGFWYARAAPPGLVDGYAKNIEQVIQAVLAQ